MTNNSKMASDGPKCIHRLEDCQPSQSEERAMGDGELHESEYIENKAIGKYKIIRSLGTGSSSIVVLAYNIETNERVAIKIIKRKMESKQYENCETRIYREIVISTLLNHPNIVRLIDLLYTGTYFFLVFEYVKGTQLYDVVLKNVHVDEQTARKYFRQIVSAIDYVHKNCVVHRDLKIENILIDQNDNIKIIDFGLSNFYDNRALLGTFCGSLYFAAPELLHGTKYFGPEVDVWSLGVVLYVMICGRVPFDDESVNILQGKIKTAKFEFARPVSSNARELITRMLLPEPTKRYGMDDVKKSAWINEGYQNMLHNYMVTKHALDRMESGCVEILGAVLAFQFTDIENELKHFTTMDKEHIESLEQIYSTRRPVVSMYYLLIEEYSSRKHPQILENYKEKEMSEVMYHFVQFVFSGESADRHKRCFPKNVFKNSPVVRPVQKEPSIIWPCVRKSYLKGFFKGIKIKHMGNQNAFKKTMLDIFTKNDIIYDTTEKSYFCSYFDRDDTCYFKVSLYYNVILSEYYLVISCLNSKRVCFKKIYDVILNAFKERTRGGIPHENLQTRREAA